MDKNISPDSKSNQLAALLNENIEKSGTRMNKARIRLMSMVIIALYKVQIP